MPLHGAGWERKSFEQVSQRVTEQTLQKLLLKRFVMAACTYLLVLALVWVTFFCGYFQGSLQAICVGSLLALGSQGGLLAVFLSQANQRFKDRSLTEAQVVLGIALQTGLLAWLGSGRGVFVGLYVVVLLFGLFHLPRRVFIRCAMLVFIAFSGLTLWQVYNHQILDAGLALVEVCTLFVVLFWLCLYASYVQASRHRMRQRRFALQAHQDTLRGMMRQLEDLVATDELTGLYNRRHFLRLASRALSEMQPGSCHGLALIDLDHFKRINDAHGHAAGDQVLQAFASIARSCLRDDDVLARYGGEEFVLLLPQSDAERLRACCERLRLAFEAAGPIEGRVHTLSLSAGMTLLRPGEDLDEALHRADKALYRAKREGRNCCAAAWESVDA